MGMVVTLTGARHTDGTEGRLSVVPRTPWYVSSGSSTLAPGPMYFKINSSGELKTLDDSDAIVVCSYDSSDVMIFVPSGAAYLVTIDISGQRLTETWTIDGANDTVDWNALGVKPNATDRITYSLPMTVEGPLKSYDTVADLPLGDHEGSQVYVRETKSYYGNDGTSWFRIG